MPPKKFKAKARGKSKAILPFRLQDLSSELRVKVYKEIFRGATVAFKRVGQTSGKLVLDESKTSSHRDLLMASRATFREAITVYHQTADLVLSKGTWNMEKPGDAIAKYLPHTSKIYLKTDAKLVHPAGLIKVLPQLRGIELPKIEVEAMEKYAMCEEDLWEQLTYHLAEMLPGLDKSIAVFGSVNVLAQCTHCSSCELEGYYDINICYTTKTTLACFSKDHPFFSIGQPFTSMFG